ncbi:MAG: hypothetical protein OEX81_03630 [Candidatus Pacebacteria bacterium]|nr:hypothetical protein [Candidatus Paceibacterota bacterium]
MLLGIITACTDKPEVDVNVLPHAGVEALDLEIRHGNLTQFEAPYSISSIHLADADKVLDIYDKYFCVTVTPPIPREEYSSTTYRHFIVTLTNNTWNAQVEDSTGIHNWPEIGCPNGNQ